MNETSYLLQFGRVHCNTTRGKLHALKYFINQKLKYSLDMCDIKWHICLLNKNIAVVVTNIKELSIQSPYDQSLPIHNCLKYDSLNFSMFHIGYLTFFEYILIAE